MAAGASMGTTRDRSMTPRRWASSLRRCCCRREQANSFRGRQGREGITDVKMTMRILIYGNSGSGKSTMARQLARDLGLPLLDLDSITWQAKLVRRPLPESIALLQEFITANPKWVIEGCYADLIESALPHCSELRFLNPGVDACVANC